MWSTCYFWLESKKIAVIAHRYVVWHMGQFTADFRKQFGELPSEILWRAADADSSLS